MKLLLTGFEPFGNQEINVSEKVVQAFEGKEFEGVELFTAVLPVDQFEGPDKLLRKVMNIQPHVVICLGQAGGRHAISIEKVAINLLNFTIPDNGGNLAKDKPIQMDGHDGYFATLPTRQMVNSLKENGIPAELSYSAGAFLCNQIMYELLHHISKFNLSTQGGFIHLPLLPEQTAQDSTVRPTMSLETICKGIEQCILQTIPM
ncbi:MAG: pyroglutamyl-peptidase I [Chloroflexota bacterium]